LLYEILPASLGLHQAFTYASETPLLVGQIVRIPFGKRTLWGMVMGAVAHAPAGKDLKPVKDITHLRFSDAMRRFLDTAARYTVSAPSAFLKMALPCPEIMEHSPPMPSEDSPEPATLTPPQTAALSQLHDQTQGHRAAVFQGVTGSGKTEVYLAWLKHTIDRDGQALVLLPEIALTPQWRRRFERRFGTSPTLWHSSLTPKQRRNAFAAITSGQARVIVGTRSALFLPYANLKAIVVDEEHDLTFKQDTTPLYHGRDMAVLRGHLEQIPVILASATPSLESLNNAQRGKYGHIVLDARFQSQLPTFHIIKRPTKGLLAPDMLDKIGEVLTAGGQGLLFLNRRGYAPFALCKTCGQILECTACAVGLTYHKRKDQLLCHRCGLSSSKICHHCGGETALALSGTGVEKLSEILTEHFPKARIAIMSSDLMTPKRMEQVVHDLETQKVDILIGTQMIAKGHHFPGLTFVGVLDVDSALHHFDFRAHEHLFQMLTQVGGRAGRGSDPGAVWIQTRETEHPLFQSLVHGDHAAFSEAQLAIRQAQNLPPHGVYGGRDPNRSPRDANTRLCPTTRHTNP
jgi:primosomal protein N' (replication factor Y)